jgi:hypothetical protein
LPERRPQGRTFSIVTQLNAKPARNGMRKTKAIRGFGKNPDNGLRQYHGHDLDSWSDPFHRQNAVS